MLTLYQFNACPFCWKVKAMLHLTHTPYQVVEVTPFGMPELDFTEHKKVPVLRANSKIILESEQIVLYLQAHYSQLPQPTQSDYDWLHWVDQTLVHYLPPLIHPNIRTSFKNFKHIMVANQFKPLKQWGVRIAGALVMPRVARKMQTKHKITEPLKEFEAALNHWVQQGLKGQHYYAGEQAGLVDAVVYGVLKSGANMPFWQGVLNNNPTLKAWYERCDAQLAVPKAVLQA